MFSQAMMYPKSASGYVPRAAMDRGHSRRSTPADNARVLMALALIQYLAAQVLLSLYLGTALMQGLPTLESSAAHRSYLTVLAVQSVFEHAASFLKSVGQQA